MDNDVPTFALQKMKIERLALNEKSIATSQPQSANENVPDEAESRLVETQIDIVTK